DRSWPARWPFVRGTTLNEPAGGHLHPQPSWCAAPPGRFDRLADCGYPRRLSSEPVRTRCVATEGKDVTSNEPGLAGQRAAEPHVGGNYDFIIVANRLPVDRVTEPDGTSHWRRSPGGLV